MSTGTRTHSVCVKRQTLLPRAIPSIFAFPRMRGMGMEGEVTWVYTRVRSDAWCGGGRERTDRQTTLLLLHKAWGVLNEKQKVLSDEEEGQNQDRWATAFQ